MSISFQDVQAAHTRLRGIAHTTPIVTSRMLDARAGRSVVLKCENLQRGGAFKFRGAYNAISQLGEAERAAGVLAFSSGNHAQGVALAAQMLGVPAVICMPHDAPAVKVAATRDYGAEVIFYNRLTDDREVFARTIAEQRGMTLVPPFDHPYIMAGAGTAALELLHQAPDIDTLLVPVGGGGLLSGSCVAAHGINPALAIYGVEPADANDTALSFHTGQRQTIAPPATVADGLRPTAPGRLTFPVVAEHIRDVLLVDEDAIRAATRFALLYLKLVIEPSGAVPLAVALAGQLPAASRKVGMIISGGNIDPEVLTGLW